MKRGPILCLNKHKKGADLSPLPNMAFYLIVAKIKVTKTHFFFNNNRTY